MKYICDICDYKTDDKSNWYKHKSTIKHISIEKKYKIVESEKENNNFICENCNKVFTYKNSFYRHMKYFCSIPILNKLEIENAVLKKVVELKTTENEFHKKLTVSAGQVVNKSLSAIAFVTQNYQYANSIKTIPHDEFKRLVYEENYGKKVHKNKKITDFEVGSIITTFFRNNSLTNLLGNIITSFYKLSRKEIQSLWSTDVSRKSFVIRIENNGISQWAIDKEGVKVSELIVKPMIIYVDRLIVNYMADIHKILGSCNYSNTNYIEELKYSTKLRTTLCSNKIYNELIKCITPRFYLEKI